jgi:hypothetical protein
MLNINIGHDKFCNVLPFCLMFPCCPMNQQHPTWPHA